jgi:hypothetical protein
MGIFVELEPTPWDILERVKNRILGNRRRRNQRGKDAPSPKPPASTRQIQKGPDLGYRRPEPAASPTGGKLGVGLIQTVSSNTTETVYRVYSGNGKSYIQWAEPTIPNAPTDIGPAVPAESSQVSELGNPTAPYFNTGPSNRINLLGPYSVAFSAGPLRDPRDPPCYSGPTEYYDSFVYWSSQGSRYYYEKYIFGVFSGNDTGAWVVLPISKEVFILARRRHADVLIDQKWIMRRYQSDLEETLYTTYFDGGSSGCSGDESRAYWEGVYTVTQTGAGSQATPFVSTTEKCFVVGHGKIREITMPAALSALMSELTPAATGSGTTTQSQTVTGKPAGQRTNPYQTFIGGGETLTVSLNTKVVPPAKVLSPFKSYGLTTDTISAQSWTPGVFTAIQNPVSSSASPTTPAADQASYSGSVSLPSKWIYSCKGPVVCDIEAGRIAFSSLTTTPPSYSSGSLGSELPWRNEGKLLRSAPPTPSGGFSNQLLVAWDWEKPSYCRAKLLELGFTAADLSP